MTNNNSDTDWFYKSAINAKAICFTKGRINYYTETIDKTMPTNGQTFFYYGNKKERFIDVFRNTGLVMETI